jgi:hypothetical protein
MKKTLAGIVLTLAASSAVAQYGHYRPPIYHHNHGHNNNAWIAPLIIGGVVGAVIARESAPVVVQQPPVIIQQPLPPNAVIIDGQLYVKQIMRVDGIYREVLVRQ